MSLRVGFTFDLRDDYIAKGFSKVAAAEFDTIETIDGIETALVDNGFSVEKIGNVEKLVQRLAQSGPKQWDIVFNICEGVAGIGRESQVPCLLEAYGIPYVFSSSEVMTAAMDKAMAKRVVREVGIPTAEFRVVREIDDAYSVDLSFPLFLKPVAEGTSKGVSESSRVMDRASLVCKAEELLKQFNQPVLVETFLPGREFTVGIVGTGSAARVVGVVEIVMKQGADAWAYTLRNKEESMEEFLPAGDRAGADAAHTALKAWRALGCRDGGRIDIRLDEGQVPNFLEANAIPGLKPDYSELPILAAMNGMDFRTLIGCIMSSALERYNLGDYRKGKDVNFRPHAR